MEMFETRVDEWLSLGDVAELLGVHTSTVRGWADRGHLPVHRTQGGHRRFRRQDVEIWMHTHQTDQSIPVDVMVQSALRRTRLEIDAGKLETEGWYQKLDSDSREQYRKSGRSLLLGLINYLSSDGLEMEAEAKSLGYEYASRGHRCGLSSVEAVNAFLFFRNLLIGCILSYYEDSCVRSPSAWADMIRRLQSFTDQIMITLLDTYEAYHRGSR